jgi:hypothetical protein
MTPSERFEAVALALMNGGNHGPESALRNARAYMEMREKYLEEYRKQMTQDVEEAQRRSLACQIEGVKREHVFDITQITREDMLPPAASGAPVAGEVAE